MQPTRKQPSSTADRLPGNYGAGQWPWHPDSGVGAVGVVIQGGPALDSTHQCVTLLVCEIGRQTRSDGLLEHLLVSLTSRIVHLCSQADGLQRRRECRRRREFVAHLLGGRDGLRDSSGMVGIGNAGRLYGCLIKQIATTFNRRGLIRNQKLSWAEL